MAKSFEKRVSKRQRKTLTLDKSLYKNIDEGLLKDAQLQEVPLAEIHVKEQVRTKFNESSIRELAANIKANGLIQPLVVHWTRGKYTLICGERRFRAMSTIPLESAPCFVLENKSEQELMAIQFSENSSREALHYVDKADGILAYQKATRASERKIVAALGISKTEVHRGLQIAKLPSAVKEAAKEHDVEKYVLLEYDAIPNKTLKKKVERQILVGEIRKRAELRRILKGSAGPASKKKVTKTRKTPDLPVDLSANAFLKAMKGHAKDLDPKSRKLLNSLVEQARDMVD